MIILQFIVRNSRILVVLGSHFLVSILYLFIIKHEKSKAVFLRVPYFLQNAIVLFFVGPLFAAPFLPQQGFPFTWSLTFIFGFILIISGFLIILFSFIRFGSLPSIKDKWESSTRGSSILVRHPIYAGTLLLFLGMSLWQEAMIALAYMPVSFTLYYLMTIFEERELLELYGGEKRKYNQRDKKSILPSSF